jgi:hypothetical protein
MVQWETEHGGLRIRITEYQQKEPSFLHYFFYVFESMPVSANNWSEVMTFVHTDDVGLPKDQVRFVSNDVGYVFMGWMYAVTTDGGLTWSVWDAPRDLPNCQCGNYQLIRDVQLTADGVGTMILNPPPNTQQPETVLHTRDYGRHWTAAE